MFNYKLDEKCSLSQEESTHRVTSKSRFLGRERRGGNFIDYCITLHKKTMESWFRYNSHYSSIVYEIGHNVVMISMKK